MSDPKIEISAKSIQQSFTVGDETITPLKEVSFDIYKNSFNIIYGPSGSGKSTLLNVLSGLRKPTTGDVQFQGQDVYALSSNELAYFRANSLGLVYQSNYWVKSLNVIENVSLPLYFIGYKKPEASKLAQDALDRVDMGKYSKNVPHLLSGGEQQRIAMARALVNNPPILVADEPTGSLDSVNGDKIMQLLEKCQSEFGQTVILVTHNMEYLPLADSLLHIQDGAVELMQHGTIKETTDKMIKDMQKRIDALAEEKGHAK